MGVNSVDPYIVRLSTFHCIDVDVDTELGETTKAKQAVPVGRLLTEYEIIVIDLVHDPTGSV